MFIGNVGSSRRLDYTVIGSEVNIAQRLTSDCPGDSILITEPIRTALPDEIIIHTIDNAARNGR